MQQSEMKCAVDRYIDTIGTELCSISNAIHDKPETAYEEHYAVELLTHYMQKKGFSIEKNVAGIATAFRATIGKGKPTLAFVAEYDALPNIGHGCGHNLIAAGTVGGAVGAARMLKDLECEGRVILVGTPAEDYTEGVMGKIPLLQAGAFDDIDVCLMFHPWTDTCGVSRDLGNMVMDIRFRGRAAHAAADPWNGLNALDAAVLSYTGLSMLRQQLREDARIHMIITEGGRLVNVIPDETAARLMFRAKDIGYLQEIKKKVLSCIQAASAATGTELITGDATVVYPTNFNRTLFEVARRNFCHFGIDLVEGGWTGSTDFGNVSHRVPSFWFLMKTHRAGTPWHSAQVRDASVSNDAHEAMLLASKVMAMTAVDLFLDPQLVEQARMEFAKGN